MADARHGSVAKARVARQVTAIVRRAMRAEKQKAVIHSVRVDVLDPSWTTGRGAVLTSTVRDVVRAAAIVGSGRLLSSGVFSINSWLIQNPSFSGYAGAMGDLPGRRISIAVTSTQLRGADPDANVASTILERIGAYLAPGTPPR